MGNTGFLGKAGLLGFELIAEPGYSEIGFLRCPPIARQGTATKNIVLVTEIRNHQDGFPIARDLLHPLEGREYVGAVCSVS